MSEIKGKGLDIHKLIMKLPFKVHYFQARNTLFYLVKRTIGEGLQQKSI